VYLSAIAYSILSQTGPLATTSANLSGQLLATMTEITAQFPDVLTLPISSTQSRQAFLPQLLNGRVVVGNFAPRSGKVRVLSFEKTMSWSKWIYLGVGLALGMGSRWLLGRSTKRAGDGRETPLLEQLKQTQVAYQLAQMSQFKAGFFGGLPMSCDRPQ